MTENEVDLAPRPGHETLRAQLAALEQERDTLSSILTHSPVGLVVLDSEGTITYANARAAEIIGLTPGEMVGLAYTAHIWQVIGGNGKPLPDQEQPFRQVMASSQPLYDVQHQVEFADGRRAHLTLNLAPLHGPGDMLQGVIITIEDITRHEQAALADALRDIAAALHSTLDLNDVLDTILYSVGRVVPYDAATILLIEGDSARVINARGYAERGEEQAIRAHGLTISETRNLRHMIESREPLIVPRTADYPGWLALPGADWVRSYAGVPIHASGQTIGFIQLVSAAENAFVPRQAEQLKVFAHQAGVAIRDARLYRELENYSDILEQAVQDATEELSHAKERVEAILNSSPDSILLLGLDGSIKAGNPTFEQTFGYGIDELYGQLPLTLVVEECADALRGALQAAVEEEHPVRLECVARRKDGTRFDIDAALAPTFSSKGPVGIVCSLRDITPLKDMERMKDSFISTAAHELRTPLTAIQGFSELMLARQMDEERQRGYLQIINRQSLHLSHIVDDLLQLSRLEAGEAMELEQTTLDLAQHIREVAAPFAENSPAHELVFEGLDGPLPAWGDPFRLAQVIRNLVSNAVKYSPEGGKVTLRARAVPGFIEVSVQDEGIGLAPEHRARLFERFFRADLSNTAIHGTGLGLSICKLIVEGHGGQIWATSDPAKGSTFTFTVPVAAAEGG